MKPNPTTVIAHWKESGLIDLPPGMAEAACSWYFPAMADRIEYLNQDYVADYRDEIKSGKTWLTNQKRSITAARRSVVEGRSFSLKVYYRDAEGVGFDAHTVKYTVKTSETRWGDVAYRWTPKPDRIGELRLNGGDEDQVNADIDEVEYGTKWGNGALEYWIRDAEEKVQEKLALPQHLRSVGAKYRAKPGMIEHIGSMAGLLNVDVTEWGAFLRRFPDPATRPAIPDGFQGVFLEIKDSIPGAAGEWHYKGKVLRGSVWVSATYIGRQTRIQAAKELERITIHELRHWAQSFWKAVADLKEIGGYPKSVRNPDVNVHGIRRVPIPGEEVDEHGRIDHRLRDVEFETRLGDAVHLFQEAWQEIVETYTKKKSYGQLGDLSDIFQGFLRIFTGQGNPKSPKDFSIEMRWQVNNWFGFLKTADPKRYRLAVSKFVAEVQRLGLTKNLPKPQLPSGRVDHPAWGKSVVAFMRTYGRTYEEEKAAIREYQKFVDSLDPIQLRSHRKAVRESGDREYWVTPRWQDHLVRQLTPEELDARRTEGGESPKYR